MSAPTPPPAQPGDPHAELAARQAALAAALTRGGAVPDGFDAEAVAASAAGLIGKRTGELASQFPQLAAELGPHLRAAVAAWGAAHPRGTADSGADALAAWWITRHDAGHPYPDAAPSELLRRETAWRRQARRRWRGITRVRLGNRTHWFAGSPARPRELRWTAGSR